MKKYLFDSNTVSDFYDIESESHANLYARVSSLPKTDSLYVSVLTIYETRLSSFSVLVFSFPRASVGMPCGCASVPFSSHECVKTAFPRWRVGTRTEKT
jgi:hypothetical protein